MTKRRQRHEQTTTIPTRTVTEPLDTTLVKQVAVPFMLANICGIMAGLLVAAFGGSLVLALQIMVSVAFGVLPLALWWHNGPGNVRKSVEVPSLPATEPEQISARRTISVRQHGRPEWMLDLDNPREPQSPVPPWPTWADVLRFLRDSRQSTAFGAMHDLGWTRPQWDEMKALLFERGWAAWRDAEHPRQGWIVDNAEQRIDAVRRMMAIGAKEPWL